MSWFTEVYRKVSKHVMAEQIIIINIITIQWSLRKINKNDFYI